jgi:hypothetical protein
MSEENTPDPVTPAAQVFSLFTGKPVEGPLAMEDIGDPEIDLETKVATVFDNIDAIAERIYKEIGPVEFSESTQIFLMLRKPGQNAGQVYTTYDLRGPELIGALETAKMLVFKNYFEFEVEE